MFNTNNILKHFSFCKSRVDIRKDVDQQHVVLPPFSLDNLKREGWNADVGAVEYEMKMYGSGPNSCDAYTINGFPRPLSPCSTKDTFIQTVEQGKTYLLRIINAALNDELFFAVSLSLLESYYINKLGKTSPDGRLMTGFPEKPRRPFDYTGADPLAGNLNTEFGTKILVFPYGTNVEIVMQGTSHLNKENHSIHVHGHKFFGVGMGFGNFDSAKDPGKYNLGSDRQLGRDPVQGG
ncbi:hypothetical protein TIFTF001_015445 [Ficus carica]|uniref:Plastocyanin-like domain-containing protein n=1 Tax=Ficus carica TaxID=3494 RepID=A0AA88DIN0_FICCA|nr:hypothetical protein TIFTF001_015445 [Ficus carica]